MRMNVVNRTIVALSLLFVACDAQTNEQANADQAESEFDNTVMDLQGEFGGYGKADFSGVDSCYFLEPLFRDGNNFTHAGFFVGVEGEGVLGVASVFGGFDLVWDLYHHQMSVSRYTGAGVGMPKVGASVTAYAGFATGFSHGVSDWDGYFVTTEAEIGLPFFKDFVALEPAVFVSGVDNNGDEFISPDEILLPPDGVYGFQMGVSLGFDLLPDPSPVSGSITEGYWQPYKPAIRYYYDLLSNTRFGWVGPHLNVHLVDHGTGETCDENWPEVDGERDCIIQFGEEDWNHVRTGAHVAYSICSSLGGCELPLSWSMSLTAVAVGAYRDVGGRVRSLCPDLGNSTH